MIGVVRRVPLAVGYVLALMLCGLFVAVGGHAAAAIKGASSTGYEEVLRDGRFWTPLTSLFFTQSPLELLIVVPLAALSLGFAEWRMGTRRVLLVAVVGVVCGVVGGLAVQEIGVLGGEMWARNVQEFDVFDPFILLVAVTLAATAFVGGIWQARVRVVVLLTCAVFLLYSGQPSDLYRLIAAVIGLSLGRLLHRTPAPHRWLRSPHHEFRVLAAMVVAITAVSPVITLFSGRRYGLLAPLGLLMSGASPSGRSLANECNPLRVTRLCLRNVSLDRLDSAGPVLLAILPLATLIVAAIGLARGRRLAAWLTIVANLTLAGLGLYYYGFLPLIGTHRTVVPPNLHYWEITLSLSASVLVPVAIALVVARNLRHFTVRARPGSVASYLRLVGLSFGGLSAIYLLGGWLARDQFTQPVTFATLVSDLPERFIPISFLRHEILEFAPASPFTHLLYDWIGPRVLGHRGCRRSRHLLRPWRTELRPGPAPGQRAAAPRRRRRPRAVGHLERQLVLVQWTTGAPAWRTASLPVLRSPPRKPIGDPVRGNRRHPGVRALLRRSRLDSRLLRHSQVLRAERAEHGMAHHAGRRRDGCAARELDHHW